MTTQHNQAVEKILAQELNYLLDVRDQYEHYPYPPRNPAHEMQSFQYCSDSALDRINYYHYCGMRDFSRNFHALVAGGGTGDAAIGLAEQLRGSDAHITYLDFSKASMEVAQERAQVRQLDNITWVHGSILDAPKLLTGKFDYIDCIGVLHHLASPEAGLAALASVLKDDGVMGLMLYAKYGREGVYQLQSLMKNINKNEPDMRRKIENCKTVLNNLPKTNAFKHVEDLLGDIRQFGDAGIYDLLLHSNDIAYSIPDVYRFVASAGLTLTHLSCLNDPMGNNLYRLESYIQDPHLSDSMERLSLVEKQAAAELMHGRMIKHAFYASKIHNPIPRIDDLDNVPCFSYLIQNAGYEQVHQMLKPHPLGHVIRLSMFGKEVAFIKTANAEGFFRHMDGHKSLRDIFSAIQSDYTSTAQRPASDELLKEFEVIFRAFSLQDWLLLRHKSVPKPITIFEIQERLAALVA